MAAPSSRDTLIEYALRNIGKPVIEINVDDDQVTDRIDDAIQFMQEYHFDGIERTNYSYQVTQADIDNKYLTINDQVTSVLGILRINNGFTGGNMFSAKYQFALNDLYRFGTLDLIHHEIFQRYVSLVEQTFSPFKRFTFQRVTDRLQIHMDWQTDVKVDDWLVIETYSILDPETFGEIYNNRLLKLYITALLKKQWGSNLSKYDGIQLPGGVTMNGQQIYQEGTREVERIEETIEQMYGDPLDFYTG